ncbi:hypothetical protein [Myroides guanonis]|uniref:HTH cro/C1-type domain-containing protein n=1 Tax=Myroides guanonis TaxID=1150112 RepID=A0A1I3PEN9_9FLAO|nr:hypothetical protein [Myroides guanonis]SFJ19952.1 hypothetical protein SAMN04487893_10494 [Myroides guanonis]
MLDDKKKSEFLIKFGNKVVEIKKKKKLSFRDIANNCDLDHSYIGKIAKGTENITLETVLNLSYGLGEMPKVLMDFYFEMKEEDIQK